MSYYYGPSLVKDGLVLCLDAANPKSYVSGSTTIYDLSGNNNTGSLVNGPTYTTNGKGGIVFDGVNDYVSVNNTSTLRPSSEMTVIMWVKPTSITPNWVNLFGQNPYTGGYLIFLETGGEKIRALQHISGTEYRCNTVYKISTNGYTHICFTFKTGDAIRSYFNGVANMLKTLPAGTFEYNTSNPFYIAGPIQYGNSPYNGITSMLAIYNKALTPSEILQHYNSTKGRYNVAPEIAANVVINLDASDINSYSGTGTTWTDLSGNGYNFTLTNSPVWETHKGVKCFNFGGSDDYAVRSGSLAYDIGSSCTMQFVVASINNTDFGNCSRLISANNSANTNNDFGSYFCLASCSQTKFDLYYKGTQVNSSTSLKTANDDYKVLTVSWDANGQANIYVNGVLENSQDIGSEFLFTQITRMCLGQNSCFCVSESSYIRIASFVMYDKKLSGAQVASNFNSIRSKYSI